jgi:hypothetical protein
VALEIERLGTHEMLGARERGQVAGTFDLRGAMGVSPIPAARRMCGTVSILHLQAPGPSGSARNGPGPVPSGSFPGTSIREARACGLGEIPARAVVVAPFGSTVAQRRC